MLIALVALVALANGLIGLLPSPDAEPLKLERLVGWLIQPAVWCLGVDWVDSAKVSELIGTKLVLNEFIAYLNFSHLPVQAMSDKSRVLTTYLLCGFANFGSLGIVIAGLGAMAPSRRAQIVTLGYKALGVGALATCLSSAVASLVLFAVF
jgi:CNT family concentrative nucleoside transporter